MKFNSILLLMWIIVFYIKCNLYDTLILPHKWKVLRTKNLKPLISNEIDPDD